MQGIINIKGKDYMLINERLRLAHETRESFEMVSSGPVQVGPMVVWQVAIRVDGVQYIGTAEIKFDAPPKTADATNPVACAETSATGRALGFAGIGAIESVASADEVLRAQSEQHQPPKKQLDPNRPCSDQQFKTINKLQEKLGMAVTDCHGLSFQDCANLISELSKRVQKQPA